MSSNIWLPPIIALTIGLIGAFLAARLLRAKARGNAKTPDRNDAASDLRLRVRDLEIRRDELYQRLAQADEEGLGEAERADLEQAAARTLRDLDQAQAAYAAAAPEGAKTHDASSTPDGAIGGATVAPHAVAGRVRSAAVIGFLSGFATAALVGILFYWADRDAKPRPMEEQQAGRPVPGGDEPHGDAPLPPVVASQVAELEAQIGADPDDLDARKQLALTLLSADRFVPAFEQASEVLQRSPGDPDAVFVHGVVRIAMGQNPEGIRLLDQVLESYPQHVYALLYKGIGQVRLGQQDEALATWREGIAQAGGSQPEIEGLMAELEQRMQNGGAPAAAPAAASSAAPSTSAPGTGSQALVWQTPTDWAEEKPSSPMRRAQYRVPGPGGDAELVVFYFGPGQGGDALANAQRWAGQFRQADGSDSVEAMTTSDRKVGDTSVMMVEVGGIYSGGMSGASESSDYHLLGAIAEGPDANWFFKLTGPESTVESQRAGFDALVASLRPGQG